MFGEALETRFARRRFPMNEAGKLKVVIVGGGTSGWMTAAAMSQVLRGKYDITLVESEEIGTVGVGESTIPMIALFNAMLQIDEDEFVRETQATFKLGIEFVNWARLGDRYIHSFGTLGQEVWTVDFHQYWLKQYLAGKAPELEKFSINAAACGVNKFMRPRMDMPKSPLSQIRYAFQFDASLYARYLRKYAEQRGVKRVEGRITSVQQREGDGFVSSVTLQSGEVIEGGLFVDCSGFRALLIEGTLKTGFEDWSHWLPCDRAVAVPSASSGPLTPFTRCTARGAGWQWRIPLQHRVGNGHVYASKFMSEDEATATLLSNLDGPPLAEPRPLRFQPGRRRKSWNRNVVAVGLASGFIEPLESTSIHLVQMAIAHLLTYFPSNGFDDAVTDQFNRMMSLEYEWVRDFIILHYKATERTDTPFWNYCREMEVPEQLRRRMALFRADGRVFRDGDELFAKTSWVQVLHGQRVVPRTYHPLTDLLGEEEIATYLDEVAGVIGACVDVMPPHEKFIADHCSAAVRAA
jgi:tryptophan 7-halogenase